MDIQDLLSVRSSLGSKAHDKYQHHKGGGNMDTSCWKTILRNIDLVDFMAFVNSCHLMWWERIHLLHFLGHNKYSMAFWQSFLTKDSRRCSCVCFHLPSPTLLQCVLFWNTQFSYKQSTLSTTCFCTFWNGALRQINENKYGSLPVKILQTVSSQGHWLRQHIILFTVESENPFLPIQ